MLREILYKNEKIKGVRKYVLKTTEKLTEIRKNGFRDLHQLWTKTVQSLE